MFDIDGGKLLIIGIVALVVIGPKELPGVLRQMGQAIAKLRRMASEFQGQFMDAMKEAELDELRKDVSKMTSDVQGLNPLEAVRKDIEATKADIESALDNRLLDSGSSPASVDMSGLPSGPPDGTSTLAEGIAPVATPPEASLGGPMSMSEPAVEPVPVPQPARGQSA